MVRKEQKLTTQKKYSLWREKSTVLSRVTREASLKRRHLSKYLKNFRQHVMQLCGWKTLQEQEATKKDLG